MTIANLHTLIRFLTKTDGNSFTDSQILILFNASYERLVGELISETMGAHWIFGDSRYTSLPVATGNLTSGTQAYQLQGNADVSATGFNTTDRLLNIIGVEILDINGIYQPIEPIRLDEIHNRGSAQSEFFKSDGKPVLYELREDFIHLYPAPDNGVSVTLTNGLKIFFQRTARVIESGDQSETAMTPGLPSPWHDVIAYEVAYHYAIANSLPNMNFIKGEWDRKEKGLIDFVSRRNVDAKKVLRPRITRFR